MSYSNVVNEVIVESLRDKGFKKKSNNWYWSNEDVVLVINLKKSQYGEQYYINCGVAMKCLGAIDFPKENHCDIRFRIASVLPEEKRNEINELLDLENKSLSDDARKDGLCDFIKLKVLPLLTACVSLVGIREEFRAGRLQEWMMTVKILELMNGEKGTD